MPPKRPLVKGGKLTPKVDLNPSDLEEILVPGFGKAAEQVLENFGWTGLAAATVGLSLAGDNKRILETIFSSTESCLKTRHSVGALGPRGSGQTRRKPMSSGSRLTTSARSGSTATSAPA